MELITLDNSLGLVLTEPRPLDYLNPANPQASWSDPALWADLAHALVNTKEFIFLR